MSSDQIELTTPLSEQERCSKPVSPWRSKRASLKEKLKLHTLRILELTQTLFRTLGLAVLTFLRGKEEPPKVLLQSSYRLALARCTIHIAPALVSACLVAINLMGYFTGSELQGVEGRDEMKMGLLQVAAKVQELLVVASVGSVIFHILRSELISGEGVPLGILVSGWSFSQIQYFWSAEFLGVLWGVLFVEKDMPRKERWKRRGMMAFITVGGGLALIAGPAAALLMIPRQKDWPVGGGIYWLNGSTEQLWPNYLDAEYYSDTNCSSPANQFLENRCPAAGFLPLHQYFSSWWNHLNTGWSFEVRDFYMRKMVYSRPALLPDANTWSYTSHTATATLQDAMRALHREALEYLHRNHPLERPYPKHLMWANPVRFEVETKVPAARVFCQPQGMVWLWGENLTMSFPSIREIDQSWEGAPDPLKEWAWDLDSLEMKSIDVLQSVQRNLASRGILKNSSALLHGEIFQEGRRTLIVPVETKSTSNSLDLAVLLGATWNVTNDEITPPSNVLACSIDARWVKAKTFMEMRSHDQLSHEYHLGRVRNLIETESDFLNQRTLGYARFKPPADGSWPEIRLSESWYNMLAPTLPDEPFDGVPWIPAYGSKQTTLEALFDLIYDPVSSPRTGFENVIATAVVDGLSRCGLIPNYNGSRFLEAWPYTSWTVDDEGLARTLVRQGGPQQSFDEPSILKPNSTKMVMRATYGGYVMEASGWFDYLSIAALLTHALIALVHSILLVRYRTTSGAWDTILELVALTQKSNPPPEPLLDSTSAGVRSFKTVKLLASVEAPQGRATGISGGDQGPIGELQMRVRDPWVPRNPSLKPERIGQTYGSPTMLGR